MEPAIIRERECPKCSGTMRSKAPNGLVYQCTNQDCHYHYVDFKRMSYSKFEEISEPLPWKQMRPAFVEDEVGNLTHRWHYGRREWVRLTNAKMGS